MSPQDRELMQKALVANEQALAYFDEVTYLREQTAPMRNKLLFSSQALRARLAEPDDEPMAWMDPSIKADDQAFAFPDRKQKWPHLYKVPLYTRPAARKVQPMTREQVAEIWIEHGCDGEDAEGFARAVERAHGITGDSHE